MERGGGAGRQLPGAQAHRAGAARAAVELSGHRHRAWPLGLSLPSGLSHGGRHVPRSADPLMNATRITMTVALLALSLPLSCWGAAPAADTMPDRPDQAMGALTGMDDTAAVGK